jgi:hypothetical protein
MGDLAVLVLARFIELGRNYNAFLDYCEYYGVYDADGQLQLLEKFVNRYFELQIGGVDFTEQSEYDQVKALENVIGDQLQYIEKDWLNFGYPRVQNSNEGNRVATYEEMQAINESIYALQRVGLYLPMTLKIGLPKPRPQAS